MTVDACPMTVSSRAGEDEAGDRRAASLDADRQRLMREPGREPRDSARQDVRAAWPSTIDRWPPPLFVICTRKTYAEPAAGEVLEQLRLLTAPAERIERWRTAAGERGLTLGQLAADGLELAFSHASVAAAAVAIWRGLPMVPAMALVAVVTALLRLAA